MYRAENWRACSQKQSPGGISQIFDILRLSVNILQNMQVMRLWRANLIHTRETVMLISDLLQISLFGYNKAFSPLTDTQPLHVY